MRMHANKIIFCLILAGCVNNHTTSKSTNEVPNEIGTSKNSTTTYVSLTDYRENSIESALLKPVWEYAFSYYLCGESIAQGVSEAEPGFAAKLSSNMSELCTPILSEARSFIYAWNKLNPKYGFDVQTYPTWEGRIKNIAVSQVVDFVKEGKLSSGGYYPADYLQHMDNTRKKVSDIVATMTDAPEGAISIASNIAITGKAKSININYTNFSKYIPYETASKNILGVSGYLYSSCAIEMALKYRKGTQDVNTVVDVALRECAPVKNSALSALAAWQKSNAPFKPDIQMFRGVPDALETTAKNAAVSAVVKANAGDEIKPTSPWKDYERLFKTYIDNISKYN